MRSARIGMGLLAVVAMVPGQAVRPPARSPAQQAVVRLEQRWLAHEGDAQVVAAILADDFVHVTAAGMVTRAQQLAYVRAHPGAFSEERRFERLRVRIYGPVAVATGVVVAVAAGGAQRRTRFTDVFVQRGGRWLAVNAQETSAG